MSSCPVHSCIIGGRKNNNWWHCFAANCNQGILKGSPNSDKLNAWTLLLLWQKILFQFVYLDPNTWSKQLFGDPVRFPGAGCSSGRDVQRWPGDREDPSYPHIVTADLLQNICGCVIADVQISYTSSYHGPRFVWCVFFFFRKRIILLFLQPAISVAAVWMVAPDIGAPCL